MIDLIKSDTFWSAVSAVATLIGAGAILFAARQLRFEAWLKAMDIWVAKEFTDARTKLFARLENLQAPSQPDEKELELFVCRRVDEFVRLAPYLGRRRLLSVWGDPLAKAWLLLEARVHDERVACNWPTKWDAFERIGRKALGSRTDLQAKRGLIRTAA
jgi:hypothetical protein